MRFDRCSRMLRQVTQTVVEDAVLLIRTDAQIPEGGFDFVRRNQRPADAADFPIRRDRAVHFRQRDAGLTG